MKPAERLPIDVARRIPFKEVVIYPKVNNQDALFKEFLHQKKMVVNVFYSPQPYISRKFKENKINKYMKGIEDIQPVRSIERLSN